MKTAGHVAIAISLVLLAGCGRVEAIRDRFGRAEASEAESVGQPTGSAAALEVSGAATWDGVPSLGGVWIAHPDVAAPVRVRISRTDSGLSAEGWLFSRDAGGDGPQLRASSEAAAALGIDAGEVAELTVEPLGIVAQEQAG